MHKRPMWIRLAALAIVLALASPVWATESEMKKKEDPKAEQKQGAPQQKKQDPAKDAKDAKGAEQQQAEKKNCSVDIMSFNTLEDMYGLVGPVDPLALQKPQPAELADLKATEAKTATQAVEWRTVEKAEKTDDEAKKKDE